MLTLLIHLKDLGEGCSYLWVSANHTPHKPLLGCTQSPFLRAIPEYVVWLSNHIQSLPSGEPRSLNVLFGNSFSFLLLLSSHPGGRWSFSRSHQKEHRQGTPATVASFPCSEFLALAASLCRYSLFSCLFSHVSLSSALGSFSWGAHPGPSVEFGQPRKIF